MIFNNYGACPGKATKQCLPNGTWYERDGLPWTDYTQCLDKSVSYYYWHYYGNLYFTTKW